jgi:hypothetical protein
VKVEVEVEVILKVKVKVKRDDAEAWLYQGSLPRRTLVRTVFSLG